ncbi:MAG: hypothetical protein HYT20_03850 [Candidatus Nealsonbacteria bacterium]|nr:hypothetical protein [Candidatus Nealsonbacteria bacterium]
MKKVLLTLVLAGTLIVPAMSFAVVETSCDAIKVQTTCNTAGCNWNPQDNTCSGVLIKQTSDLIDLINKIGNWVFAALLSIAAIFLIVSGLMWVTAGGNPEKANKARQMLINALIGVAIALLARGMVMVIRSVIGG